MDSQNRAALIVSGGVAHDFPTSSQSIAEVLTEAGFSTTITTDAEGALRDPAAAAGSPQPLLVLNLLRWTMQVERYAHLRDEWGLSLDAGMRQGLTEHVTGGGGLLAMHGASICFDDWDGWKELLGGVWRWDRSSHPPLDGSVRVTVATDAHPVVAGVADFEVVDEVYGFLDLAPDVQALMTSPHGGADHPLLWAREVGRGRVVYDALGHDPRSFEVPEHRRIVQQAARWAASAL